MKEMDDEQQAIGLVQMCGEDLSDQPGSATSDFALAWWCGTGRMTGGGKLVSVVATAQVDVTRRRRTAMSFTAMAVYPTTWRSMLTTPTAPFPPRRSIMNCYTRMASKAACRKF